MATQAEQPQLTDAQTDVTALVKELLEAGETAYDGPDGTVFLQDVNKELEASGRPTITAMQLDMAYKALSGQGGGKTETGQAGAEKPKRGGRRKKEDSDAGGAKVDSDGVPYAAPQVALPTVLYHAEKEAVTAKTAAEYDALRKANYRPLMEFEFGLRKQIHTREANRPRRA